MFAESQSCQMRRVPTRRGRLAFTLVELMIVIALIGIMTAMILPELRGTYEETLLRSTSRELINAFSLAQSRAVSVNQPHRVRVESSTGKYRIEKRVRTGGAAEFVPANDFVGSEGDLDSRILIQIRIPDGAQPENATGPPDEFASLVEPVITFFPDGTADAREVLLQDRQGFHLLLRVNPITSRVRIASPPPGGPP